MKSGEKSSYKSIFKANALFGGVQLYQIMIQVIRSKFIAILLGPAGVGIQGLYTSATTLISTLSAMGLSQSAVRDVSEAYGSNDNTRVSRTIKVLQRLIWITGIIGSLAVFVLSPVLSRTSFGSSEHTIPFMILSVTLLFDQLCSGQKTILQGTHRLKDLARASAIGATIGLLVSVPLYYWFGVKGIVPTLILQSLTALFLSWYFSRKVKLEPVSITYKETFKEGTGMLKMGLALCFTGILTSLSSYVLRSYISNFGGTDDVGLYVAGFAIVNTYVGMIFTAISTDYYPRLAAVNKNNELCRIMVNEQGEIATLIMAPLLMICIIYMPLVVRILYSEQFEAANNYILWAICGMLFKLSSWVIGFQFIAKAESKLFMINELAVFVYGLALSIVGYRVMGLTGVGIAFLVYFLIYALQTYLIAHVRYGFYYHSSFLKPFIVQLVLLSFCLTVAMVIETRWIMYLSGTVLIIVSSVYSLKGLNDRMDIKGILKTKFK